jgi:hypothetical protein
LLTFRQILESLSHARLLDLNISTPAHKDFFYWFEGEGNPKRTNSPLKNPPRKSACDIMDADSLIKEVINPPERYWAQTACTMGSINTEAVLIRDVIVVQVATELTFA